MAKSHCDIPESGTASQPIAGNYYFQQIAKIIGGSMGAAAVLIMFLLIIAHGCFYTRRSEQKQVVRIFLLPIAFAVFYVLSIISYNTAPYLEPLPHLFEAVAICAFWELMTSYAIHGQVSYQLAAGEEMQAPKTSNFEVYSTAALDLKNQFNKRVYQLPPVILLVTIITEIIAGSMCPTSTSYHRATLVIQIIRTISTVLALIAIIKFYSAQKASMAGRKVFAKLLIFKGLVGLFVLQTLIFNILSQRTSILAPTAEMSWYDWHHGLPSLLIACYCPVFGLLFAWAFSPLEYSRVARTERGHAGHAVLDAFNVVDIVLAMMSGLASGRRE